MAEHKALTAKRIEKLRKQPGRYRDGSGEAKGLYLQVASPTNASWLLRYQSGGRERWMGLGPLETVSLKEARDKAAEERKKLKSGTDPITARRANAVAQALANAKNKTFKQVAEDYLETNRHAWKNAKHERQWTATLQTYVYPKIGHLPVAGIDTPLVLACIRPIWTTKTETASRVRGRIETVLDFATVSKYRSGENPARWTGNLEHILPAKGKVAKVEHHAALPYAELPAFMAALRQREGTAARALEFTILTAARTGEVIGAQWDEINLDTKIWTVPEGRMKAGKEHRVALSDAAIKLLQSLPREQGNPWVFLGPQRGGLSNMAMTSVLRRMGRGDVTVHGFRSCFRDWCAERTNYPSEVAEMALAHAVSGKVEAAYRRGDLLAKRHRLAADWSKFCSSPPATSAAESNVVAIRGEAS